MHLSSLGARTPTPTTTTTTTTTTVLSLLSLSLLLSLAASQQQQQQQLQFDEPDSLHVYTTKDCVGDTPLTRTCTFTNMCYDGSSFLYHVRESDVRGVPLPLLKVGVYSTSPDMPIKIVPKPFSRRSIVKWIKKRSFLFFRGHSKDFFSALMDDYLGLFWEMHYRFQGRVTNDNQIIVFDDYFGHLKDKFPQLPWVFSNHVSESLTDLWKNMREPEGYVCFEDLTAGPAEHSLLGPGQFHIHASFLYSFRKYMTEMLEMPADEIMEDQVLREKRVSIIVRNHSRKILNLPELVKAVEKKAPGTIVATVELEKMTFSDQVRAMLRTSVLVGMHGAGLANSLFLPKTSSVLELFPYKVNRPIFASIITRLLELNYTSWQNKEEANAKFFPEKLEQFSLTSTERMNILSSANDISKNPAAAFYWLQQDTIVDVEAVSDLIAKMLAEKPKVTNHGRKQLPPMHHRVNIEDTLKDDAQREKARQEYLESLPGAKKPTPPPTPPSTPAPTTATTTQASKDTKEAKQPPQQQQQQQLEAWQSFAAGMVVMFMLMLCFRWVGKAAGRGGDKKM